MLIGYDESWFAWVCHSALWKCDMCCWAVIIKRPMDNGSRILVYEMWFKGLTDRTECKSYLSLQNRALRWGLVFARGTRTVSQTMSSRLALCQLPRTLEAPHEPKYLRALAWPRWLLKALVGLCGFEATFCIYLFISTRMASKRIVNLLCWLMLPLLHIPPLGKHRVLHSAKNVLIYTCIQEIPLWINSSIYLLL